MKFTTAFALAFGLGVASANPLVEKRASTSDKATVGYATLSGGLVHFLALTSLDSKFLNLAQPEEALPPL
jgi:hypothetical protein